MDMHNASMSHCDFVRPYCGRPLLRRPGGGSGLRLRAVDDADRQAPRPRTSRSSAIAFGSRWTPSWRYAVTGATTALAHPALVCDVAIGQSTLATQRVKANLFYRGLTFHRFPVIGDSLFTRTEVVGLKQNSAKPGRAPTGLAALRMTTVDQIGRLVLDFYRCAMLPLSTEHRDRSQRRPVGHRCRGRPAARPDRGLGRRRIPRKGAWRPLRFRTRRCGAAQHRRRRQQRPELARLTLNIAATHHDWRVGGQRLVYGGHTIGLALAQATRLLPNLVTVLGWESCDHTGPVHEGDTLYSELHVDGAVPLPDGRGGVLKLRSLVYAVPGGGRRRPRSPGTGLSVHRPAVLSTMSG